MGDLAESPGAEATECQKRLWSHHVLTLREKGQGWGHARDLPAHHPPSLLGGMAPCFHLGNAFSLPSHRNPSGASEPSRELGWNVNAKAGSSHGS